MDILNHCFFEPFKCGEPIYRQWNCNRLHYI